VSELSEARLGDIAPYTAILMPRGEPVSALASDFLVMAAERACEIDPLVGVNIAQQVLDLVAIAFCARVGTAAKLSSPRIATLTRLRSVIEARARDPELKLADVAAAAGISVRYANALLAQERTSIERFIMLRRLQHCRPGRCSLFSRPFFDQTHDGLDLRAIMILVGSHEQPVLDLHNQAEAAIEYFPALAVAVHELDLITHRVAVGR
jgi:hypothetical protein